MTTIRVTAIAFGLAALYCGGLSAQTQETQTTTKTKIEVKGGKNVTVIGCLEQQSNGDYVLTDARDNNRPEWSRYTLVTDKDLSKHVGERVEIGGKAVTHTDGKVKVESKTKTEVENGQDRETTSKTEGTTGAFEQPYLGVHSIKKLSSSCK
ncbi:MAG TPA: hypothetical protein VFA59_21990 [Vicinamibacterales bacterium]|nr:hypothetical protein [Vicinamibacterales bacterium]